MRSALPSAVNRRGEAAQPLGFHLLIFVPPADFGTKGCENRSQTALCLCRACVYPIRAASRYKGRHRGVHGGVLYLRHEWGLLDFLAVQIFGEHLCFFLCCELP